MSNMESSRQNTLRTAAGAVLCAAMFGTSISRSPADVTNLSVVADTFINSGLPDNNAGGEDHVAAGKDGSAAGGMRRGLFRFDLSAIPAGSTVTSATLRINVVFAPFGSDSTFDVFRLTAAWGEGTNVGPGGAGGNNGAPATTGEASWNSRQFGVNIWTGPGAAGDYATPALAATFVSGVATYAWSSPSLRSAAQSWLDNPAQNFGVILISEQETTARTVKRFGSREGGSPANLQVGYVPPAPPQPFITSLALSTNRNLQLTWTNAANWKYDVEYTGALSSNTHWQIAEPNIPASPSGTNVWTDAPYLAGPLNPANTNLFFRLHALPAAPAALPVFLDTVVSNLAAPTVLTHAGDSSRRLFIADQTGPIWIVDSNLTLLATPFLDLTSKMTNLASIGIGGVTNAGLNPVYDERGLLGLAFHPNYKANGRFFVFHSSPKTGPGINCESILAEYRVSATDANVADPATERVLLRVDKPEFNHNGGAIAFGPDGYLYVPLGDGGGAGDQHPPIGNAQNTNVLLGKILRIDVDSVAPYGIPSDNPFVGTSARQEIYAYGLRNPWKMSFDRSGARQLFVADVGQNLWEEIDIVRKGGNYGWRILEGNHAYDLALAQTLGTDIPALDFPIHEYGHGPTGIAIIGGYVYRGANYPALAGKYLFGDFSTSFGAPDGALYYLDQTRPGLWERFEIRPGGSRLGRYVKGFGEDETGEIYLLSSTRLGPSGTTGDVRRIRKP